MCVGIGMDPGGGPPLDPNFLFFIFIVYFIFVVVPYFKTLDSPSLQSI